MDSAYKKLVKLFTRQYRLTHMGAMIGWDEAVMMPAGGGEARGKAMAELALISHELFANDDSIADLLAAASEAADPSDQWHVASIKTMKRQWQQTVCLPADLVEAKSLASTKCEQAWRHMRGENDWKNFKPIFTEVVNLTRKEAEIRSGVNGTSKYNALLDLYEPGQKSENIDIVFAQLKAFLPQLIQEIAEKQKTATCIQPVGPFTSESQKALGLKIMAQIGFDFDHGRLDVSHHPFCGGVPEDVRITTRYSEDDFVESIMGVIHESGHASYEQGLPAAYRELPVGCANGLGMHESQSLIFEMQICRSPEFISFLTPWIIEHFGQQGDAKINKAALTPDNIQAIYLQVKPDFIRVNADEVTYPCHVILRYEIEKALIEGAIEVADIPELWNEKMETYLRLSTKGNYKDGCMQDVHWPSGALGYFPTYTLGAMNAAQLFAAMQKALPQVKADIKAGDFSALRQWLKENVWSQASLHSIEDLMAQATGEPLNGKYFETHLRQRYL